MNSRYCLRQYFCKGETTLFCNKQLSVYHGEFLHTPCDVTRENVINCEHRKPKCMPHGPCLPIGALNQEAECDFTGATKTNPNKRDNGYVNPHRRD